MKKINLIAAFIAVLFLVISIQEASGLDNKLDSAIRELSDYLNTKIPKENKAVFLNIKSDWTEFSDYILSGLTENAVNDGVFTVVDRQHLNDIRKELNFQWSGEVNDKTAVEIGKMIGAQIIVSGNVTDVGNEYRIQVRALSVQTATVQGQLSKNIGKKEKFVITLTTASSSGYVNSGNEFIENKKYNKAIAEFNSALRINPNNTDAYLGRGRAYYNDKKYDLAITDYNKVLSIDPNNAEAYSLRGLSYFLKDEDDKAIADETYAISLDPNNAVFYSRRSNIYRYKKEYDMAIEDRTKMINLDPNNAYYYYLRGAIYNYKKDYDQAINDFTQAINLKPNSAIYYLARGINYYNISDYDLAISDFEATLRLDPKKSDAKDMLKKAQQKKNR